MPAGEILKQRVTQSDDYVNYGINMYFKQPHVFSWNPDQGGGELAPNQAYSSMPWGVMGCPSSKQEILTDYVTRNMKKVVFCRYGLEYLHSFPRNDDTAIASFRINLDYLIFQKQKHFDNNTDSNLVGLSFLKTKGQHEMNKQIAKGNFNSSIIMPFYHQSQDSESLSFDSVFESGNLALALRESDYEYNLLL